MASDLRELPADATIKRSRFISEIGDIDVSVVLVKNAETGRHEWWVQGFEPDYVNNEKFYKWLDELTQSHQDADVRMFTKNLKIE